MTYQVYLDDGRAIHLPEVEVPPQPGDKLHAMRGYGYTLAVFRDGAPIGYCAIEAINFATVKEWIQCQPQPKR